MEPTNTPMIEEVLDPQNLRPVFYTRIKHDFTEWFELEGVIGARWFCKDHGFNEGDEVRIVIERVTTQ